MATRRYPHDLTEAQRKMMRRVELGHFRHHDGEVLKAHPKGGWVPATGREQMRLRQLGNKGCLVETADSYQHADDLVEIVTYFAQEEYGNIKIGVADSLKIISRLHLAHPRPVKMLGGFEGHRLLEVTRTCNKHHIKNGWYKPHADVLAWTKRRDFQKA